MPNNVLIILQNFCKKNFEVMLTKTKYNGKKHIHRPPNKNLDLGYTTKKLKHDREKVFIWSFLAPLQKIIG